MPLWWKAHHTAHKESLSKGQQVYRLLRNLLFLLQKFLKENLIFCTVTVERFDQSTRISKIRHGHTVSLIWLMSGVPF